MSLHRKHSPRSKLHGTGHGLSKPPPPPTPMVRRTPNLSLKYSFSLHSSLTLLSSLLSSDPGRTAPGCRTLGLDGEGHVQQHLSVDARAARSRPLVSKFNPFCSVVITPDAVRRGKTRSPLLYSATETMTRPACELYAG